jgi:hypothetical protein
VSLLITFATDISTSAELSIYKDNISVSNTAGHGTVKSETHSLAVRRCRPNISAASRQKLVLYIYGIALYLFVAKNGRVI